VAPNRRRDPRLLAGSPEFRARIVADLRAQLGAPCLSLDFCADKQAAGALSRARIVVLQEIREDRTHLVLQQQRDRLGREQPKAIFVFEEVDHCGSVPRPRRMRAAPETPTHSRRRGQCPAASRAGRRAARRSGLRLSTAQPGTGVTDSALATPARTYGGRADRQRSDPRRGRRG
jgi:hypothetical protein